MLPTSTDEETDELLDPIDEHQLTSQLGFVPGNVICVAARLTSEFTNTNSTSSAVTDASDNGHQSNLNIPSVVKLYPMVVRDSYHGGKSDGRKFKGRRRGGKTSDSSESNNLPPQDENMSSKERCWFIETEQTQNNEDDNEKKRQIIEPFPTLYWLTSPLLRSYISQIELSKTNGVQQMEQKLRSSSEYLDQMERAHKSYGKQRWDLLTDEDREEVLQRGWREALGIGRGVAGIRPKRSKVKDIHGEAANLETWDGVKCLHAHAAHYLAQIEEWKTEKINCDVAKGDDDKNCEGDLATLIQECNRDDLNLVGKWTMEAVLYSLRDEVVED